MTDIKLCVSQLCVAEDECSLVSFALLYLTNFRL